MQKIAVLLMIFVAIHILAAFWPIFWIARLAPVSSIEWVGSAGIASFYGLCFLRVLQAGMLRLLFNLSWDPVTTGAASALASVIMTIIGLLFVFVVFSQAFVKKGIPASAMVTGGSRAMKKAPERYKNSRERIGNVRQRMEGIRGGSSGGNGGGTRPDTSASQVGSTGSAVRSSSHHRSSETVRQVGEVQGGSHRKGVDAQQVERRRRVINDRLN